MTASRAAVAVEGEEVAQLLGFHLLGQHRRADQVGEQQRHQRPFARTGRPDGRPPRRRTSRGTAVVGVDGAHLLGGGAGRLEITGGQRCLGGGQQPFEQAAEPRLGRTFERGHGRLVRGAAQPLSPSRSGWPNLRRLHCTSLGAFTGLLVWVPLASPHHRSQAGPGTCVEPPDRGSAAPRVQGPEADDQCTPRRTAFVRVSGAGSTDRHEDGQRRRQRAAREPRDIRVTSDQHRPTGVAGG